MKRIVLIIFTWLMAITAVRAQFSFYAVDGNGVTGPVTRINLTGSGVTSAVITNIGGMRWYNVTFSGGGGGGGGGTNNTILVSGNGVTFTDGGGGTNILAIDASVVVTNGGFKINGVSVVNGGSATISAGTFGATNVLDTAGGPFDLVGHTNQPTLLIKGLSNATPATLTITDFGTFLGFTVASQGGFGSTNAWTTNGLPWSVSDTFGFSNASSVVTLAFTNLGGVPTIYLVPDSTIARTGQSQTWSAPQSFNSSATLTLGAPLWMKSSLVVSDNVTIVSNATISGSATVTGNLTSSGTGSFGHFGAGQIDSGTIGSNTFPVTGITANTYGDASHPVIIGVGSDGRIYSIQQVAIGSVLGSSTNSIYGVFANGVSNNPVTFLSFQNFSVHTLNGTTSTVGFANLPFDSITVINGTTNFTLHGSSLTISNLLAGYGVTLTNRGSGQIDLGGTVTMLSNSAGAFLSVSGDSGNTTQKWSGTSSTTLLLPNNNAPVLKFGANGAYAGVNPSASLVVMDGTSDQYLNFARDGGKSGFQGLNVNDSSGGNLSFGQYPGGIATGDKRHVQFSTSTSVGGLIVVDTDNAVPSASEYSQFYENDLNFPRILFTNNKQATNTNTPSAHETYASFGNWNYTGGAALSGGALIVIGSNENWLVACGRALGSINGVKAKEYPTNAVSGFLAAGLSTPQSNQTFVVIRDQTNGVWCIGVDTNGVLGAYRTNDLSTTVATY